MDTSDPDHSPSALDRSRISGRELALAFVVAVAIRLLMVGFVDIKLVNDAATYDLMARNLVEHGIFSHDIAPPYLSSGYRPPLYPALLAGLFALFGHRLAIAQGVQILISLLAIWILVRTVQRVQPASARWTLWLLVLSPFEAVYSIAFLSEGLTSFLISAAFAAWITLRGTRRWIGLGGLLGLAALCRDIYIALPPFFGLLWLLFGDGSRRGRLSAGTILVTTTLLVVSPWSVRNAISLEKWVPITGGRLGISLWIGSWTVDFRNVHGVDGKKVFPPEAYLNDPERSEHEALVLQGDIAALDRFYMRSFARRVQQQPVQVLGRWIRREPLLWLGTRFDIFELNPRLFPYGSMQWNAAKAALFALNGAYILLGLAGMVIAWRRKSPLRWWSAPILFTALVYLPMNSYENRYSQPVYALLVVFGAMAVEALVAAVRARSRRASAAAPIALESKTS